MFEKRKNTISFKHAWYVQSSLKSKEDQSFWGAVRFFFSFSYKVQAIPLKIEINPTISRYVNQSLAKRPGALFGGF